MTYTLFLDDERCPTDDSSVIVRSYNEAVAYVREHGTPDHVDFDHDLGEGRSGYDFAVWLCDRALDGGGFPATYDVHSQNPIGKRKIIDIMNDMYTYREGYW